MAKIVWAKTPLGQKVVNQVWEYEVKVNVQIEIISSKEQIETGAHLVAVVNSFDKRKATDIKGNPEITPAGVAMDRTAFVNAGDIKNFGGQRIGGHEVLHTLGLNHFWKEEPGDRGNQSNFMDYPPFAGFSLTNEQRGEIFSQAGLSPYSINSYNKPSGKGISLYKFNLTLNNEDTKSKVDENKTTVGAN